jgi:hypothetical protein
MPGIMQAAQNRPIPIEDGLRGWWKFHGEAEEAAKHPGELFRVHGRIG